MRGGAVFRVGLAWKLAGANLLIALAAVAAVVSDHGVGGHGLPTLVVVTATSAMALVVNLVLMRMALRPLHELESTIRRVVEGDFTVRVPRSAFADTEMTRVALVVNALLDAVSSDRARLRQLASHIIHASDRQRAAVARELHDSTAQALAAVMMQVGVASREEANPVLAARLAVLRDSLADLTEEVRLLARDIYPRVLEDLGLPAALRELAREAGRLASASITVEESGDASTIPLPVASALFRVAEEALANAIRHAEATHISMVLTTRVLEAAEASLLISDNGIGFDTTNVFRTGHTSGFFAMRERLGLVNGTCEVRSDVGRGTRVVAHVSLTPERILAGVA